MFTDCLISTWHCAEAFKYITLSNEVQNNNKLIWQVGKLRHNKLNNCLGAHLCRELSLGF